MKVVIDKSICRIVTVNEMQFGFTPERATTDSVFILRRMQEEHHAKGKKMCMCIVNLEKAFDRVPRKVMEQVVRKKGIPEVLVRSAMSLYEGAKDKRSKDKSKIKF